MNPLQYLGGIESQARTYAATFQRLFVSGNGLYVRDADGRTYIDCLSNAGALPLGHNHPEVKDALIQFLASDQIQQALDLATPAKVEFVKELFSLLPPSLCDTSRILFCGPTGSDAVEAAIKLVKCHTRRSTVLAFHGAYHGMTAGALAAMGNLGPKSAVGLTDGGIRFVPFPYRFRCPFGTDGSATDRLSLNYIRTLLADPECGVPKPAAIILEVVQGEGGCIPASEEWLRGLRQISREHDVLLIVDEVQTGLGRTGTMFAFQRAGITPDVLVLSKAVGGGHPLSAIVYDQRLDTWPAGTHAGTFRGNQIAMVAGRITMRIIEREGLVQNAEKMGELLRQGISRIARQFRFLGDVRGRGLMIGIEIVMAAGTQTVGAPDGEMAQRIKRGCFENGMIVETGGRNGAVLRLLPPLNVTDSQVGSILERFESATRSASQHAPQQTA